MYPWQNGGIVQVYAKGPSPFPIGQPVPHPVSYQGAYAQPYVQPVQPPMPPPPMLQPDRPPRHSTQLREISLQYSYEELSAATKNWHNSERLGSGSYGSVFKGELEDGSEVAIKAIDLKALGAESSGFEEEVQMLSKFRHPNLVTLLGWAKHDLNRYLVYELLSGGDCFQRLQKSKKPSAGCPFHWFERLSVCLDAAAGLSHMHNSKPKAFHRDIKSANILLDRHGTAKMADFGLSCAAGKLDSLHVTVRTISGTPGYACPIYSRTGRVTEGGEVYSFGMVMFELLTGLAPATADASRKGGIAYQVAEAVEQDSPGALERCMTHLDCHAGWPTQLAREMAEMALRAVQPNDEERPRFVELVKALRKHNERFPKPSQPSTFNAGGVPQLPQHLISPEQIQPAQQPAANEQHTPQAHPAKKVVQPEDLNGRPPQVKVPSPMLLPPANSALATFGLEYVSASGTEPDGIPQGFHCVYLKPSPDSQCSSDMSTFAIGRSHQQKAFEVWVPDTALQCCISRTAFEILCGAKGENAFLTVRGQGTISVDGKVAPREIAVPLQVRSEITFSHAAEGTIILRLRYLPASEFTPKVEGPTSPPPRRTVRRADEIASDSDVRSVSARPRTAWVLACVHVEGLTPGQIAELRSAVRDIQVSQFPMMLGRLHQIQLEALVKAADKPKLATFISRTHGKLEVDPDGVLRLSNVSPSSNPLYVGDDQVLPGQSQRLENGQELGFARDESGVHVHFLKFKVVQVDHIDRFASPPGRHLEAGPRRGSGEIHLSPPRDARSQRPTQAENSDAQAAPRRASGEIHLSPPRNNARSQRPTQAESSDAQEVHLLTLSPPRRKVSRDPSASSRVSGSLRYHEEVARIRPASSTVRLVLSGEGVKDNVPSADRQIGPISLLQQPDHTLIRTLTSNPIWRVRSDAEPVELQRGEPVDLQSGDRIALGTGSDNAPESAVQSLCWLFTVEGTELAQANSFEGCRTPPSPGGAGPRISDLPPIIRVLRTDRSLSPDSPASPARERIMSEGGPKAKAKSRYK
ncbi:unnamed protein product [Durusdinium trenchii]|uniref:Protein kinase domain-containing protein n=1 Tax=Durusdinium trenchii TaxID=1381693 RepID=A0ABP0NQW1_9DINO